jgi:hypothetical protein
VFTSHVDLFEINGWVVVVFLLGDWTASFQVQPKGLGKSRRAPCLGWHVILPVPSLPLESDMNEVLLVAAF